MVKDLKKGLLSRLSIKNKLILLVLMVIIPVILISFFLLITWGVREYRDKLESSMHLHAKLIGEYCISPLVFNDFQGVGEMLTKIKSMPHVAAAFLYNEDDSLVASFHADHTAALPLVHPQKTKPGFRKDFLVVLERISFEDRDFGTIIVMASTDALRRQIKGYIIQMVLIMIVMIILSYFLTNRLQGYISKPILKLAGFADKISSEGNYALRIAKEGDDEIGLLFERFNEMIEQVQLRDTASKEAEREARISNEKLSLILDNAPFGFLHYDAKGNIQTVNLGHERIFQLKKEDILGRNLYETIHDPEMLRSFDESLHGRSSAYSGRYVSSTSGSSTHIRAIYTPLLTDDNKVIGGIGIFEDISERLKSERLQMEKEAAIYANKAKSLFLANMSHEIRTPLNAILGFSQLMAKDASLTEDQRENVAIINSSGEHLLALINNVLEMSKIEAGRIQLNPGTFHIRGLLDEVMGLFRPKADEKQLFLRCEVSEDVPMRITTDEGKLRQIVINLISNAVKFTQEGGITLRCWYIAAASGTRFLNMEVEDTGAGIAPEELDKVFVHFEQTSSGRLSHSGTGLGLTICKEYVQMMNGGITVESQQDKGSVFRFFIEVAEAAGGEDAPSPSTSFYLGLEPGQPECRVLVADDKEPNRRLLVKLLESTGFSVISAANGQEAIEQFLEWHPQLILMDMVMPVKDGYGAIREIRGLPGGKEAFIIAVTASVFEEDKHNILDTGADEFIRKPFREQEIFEKISEHLGLRFIKAAADQGPARETSTTVLTAEMVDSIPGDLRKEIVEALIIGDIEVTGRCFGSLQTQFPTIAPTLLTLLKSFNFDKLNQLFRIK